MTTVQGELITSRNFEIIRTGTISVTRAASTDGNYEEVETGALGAPMFFATAYIPGSTPAFVHQLPKITYDTSSGEVWGGLRALYDPDTGNVRCFVDSTSVFPDFGDPETWTFRYYILREKSN